MRLIGKEIATLRKLYGLTQPELAEFAGVGRSTLRRFEAGDNTSLLTLLLGLAYFSIVYSFTLSRIILPSIAAVIVVSLADLLSPRGYDNITVPLLGAFIFYFINGGS